MTQLDNAVQQTDENGHRIVALKYRTDVCALRALMFALELLHSDQSEADWKLLSTMGTGSQTSPSTRTQWRHIAPAALASGCLSLTATKTFVASFLC